MRLSNNLYCFQNDFLILTLGFFLILEVKNIVGTLSFDFAARTLTRKLNGKYETYQDPTVQSTALRHQLQDWLALHCDYLPEMPVEDLVVFSPPGTYINFFNGTPEQVQKVIRGPLLKKKILSLTKRYSERLTSAKSLKLLSQRLLSSHQPKKLI
ncbi:MAG: nuclease-related domain-containing protein [Sporolactobacillus sp.]